MGAIIRHHLFSVENKMTGDVALLLVRGGHSKTGGQSLGVNYFSVFTLLTVFIYLFFLINQLKTHSDRIGQRKSSNIWKKSEHLTSG